jgi:hypothetical protein
MDNETTAMILSGSGYDLKISPEAYEQKKRVLSEASVVLAVTSNDESADAAYQMRKLAQMRILIDKSRKEVKEPVLVIGKMIDRMAKEFLEEIENEEHRIKGLIGFHAQAQLALKAEKEEQERTAFEAARIAREAAENGGVAAMLDHRQALAVKMQASEELAATKIAQGVRFVWDFEVESIEKLVKYAPELVEITPKRGNILAWIKSLESSDPCDNPIAVAESIGLKAFKKPVISTK